MRLVLFGVLCLSACLQTSPPLREAPSHLVHVVAFQLDQNGLSEDELLQRARSLERDLVEDLSPIPGVVRLHAGLRDESFTREVNLLSFDVLLVVEFTDRAAHDAYQVDERHQSLVTRWLPNLKAISVLDAKR